MTGYALSAPTLATIMIAITCIRLHELYPPLLKLRPAMLMAAVGLWYVLRRSSSSVRASALQDPTFIRVLWFIAWAGFTVPFALWVGAGVQSMQSLVPVLPVVFVILVCEPTRASVQRLTLGSLWAVTILGGALLVAGKAGIDQRVSIGESLDANDIACILAMWTPLAMGSYFRARGTVKWASLGAAGIMVLGIVATSSRGGTLALVAAALTVGAGYSGRRLLAVIGLLVVGGIGAWEFSSPAYKQRMIDLAQGKEDYNATEYAGRKAIWRRGQGYVLHSPIFGVGMGNFKVAEGKALEELGAHGKWSAPHNAYLQAFAELGVPGGLIFLSLLSLTGRRALTYWRVPRRRQAVDPPHMPELLGSLVGFAVASFFLSNAYMYAMFALVAMIALVDRAYAREQILAAAAGDRVADARPL